jgi:hypothetical protein
MHPTNGILLVTRLDGPSASIARGLVDKALEAETNGLWDGPISMRWALPTRRITSWVTTGFAAERTFVAVWDLKPSWMKTGVFSWYSKSSNVPGQLSHEPYRLLRRLV